MAKTRHRPRRRYSDFGTWERRNLERKYRQRVRAAMTAALRDGRWERIPKRRPAWSWRTNSCPYLW